MTFLLYGLCTFKKITLFTPLCTLLEPLQKQMPVSVDLNN